MWIKVADSVPDTSEDVFVTDGDIVEIGHFDGTWRWNDDCRREGGVTHWAEWPSPPRYWTPRLGKADMRETLGNLATTECHPDSEDFETWADHCRGILIGVVGVLMAQGLNFPAAIGQLQCRIPRQVYTDCVPEAWRQEMTRVTDLV